jgi:type II secretion system protein H
MIFAVRNHPHPTVPEPIEDRARGPEPALNSGAFTLVEVLCVVMLIGISAAIVVPQFATRDDLQTTAAARVLMADLMYAQNSAIATQKKHYVEFTGSSYTLYQRDSDSSALYAIANPVSHSTYSVTFGDTNPTYPTTTIASINFDGSASQAIQFDSLGLPSVYNIAADSAVSLANTGTITLSTTSGTFPTAVTIDPTSGEATVQPR